MSAMIRDYYAEEVEHLMAAGNSPEQIATRIGASPTALSKALRRAGRPDLARPFDVLRRIERAKGRTCVDCAAPLTSLASQRCVKCGHVVRARKWQERYGSQREAS